MKKLRVTVGYDQDYTYQTPNSDGSVGNVFTSADAITSTLWAGDEETALATPSVVWGSSTVTPDLGATQTLWTVQFHASDTASLTPGIYRLQVFASHSGRTGKLWDGLVVLGDTAGSNAPTDLITLVYAQSAVSRLRLSREERDFLPSLVTVASDTIRKHCGQRDFTRQIYTEEHVSELNGYVALKQFPVNAVSRIRGYPQVVLGITADSSVNQQAWVSYTTTGDWATGTLVYTGLILNAVSSGTLTTTPFLFSIYPTIAALAAAIAATPSWYTNTTPVYGLYPSTDLSPPGGLTSQGAMDDDGVELFAYTEDLAYCRLENATGFLWTGRHRIAGAVRRAMGPGMAAPGGLRRAADRPGPGDL